MHKIAWLTHAVKATDKNGNYIYKKFEDFLNQKSALSNLTYQQIQKIQTISKNI